MRWITRLLTTSVLTLLLLHLHTASGATIRVTTWNLQWFPSGTPNNASPERESNVIAAAARVIRIINPDVLLLQEIRDWDSCLRLAEALAPFKYHVLVCSAFREEIGGGLGRQQVAIMAKNHAEAAWSDSWASNGKIDPPRGYAFAVIRCEGRNIGFYTIHLKSNLVRRKTPLTRELNILKREYASEQLLVHSTGVVRSFSELFAGFVVGGDFNTNRDEFVSERTLALFESAGFLDPFASLPRNRRITRPGKGRYPSATFDYILYRGLSLVGHPEILESTMSDHYPVTVELKLP